MSYSFAAFNEKHYDGLEAACDSLEEYYVHLPKRKPLSQEQVVTFIARAKAVLAFTPHLPNAGAGQPKANKMAVLVTEFEEKYLNKPEDRTSFLAAVHIASHSFSIHNYMSAMCDREGPKSEDHD
jgi:hypothetical protein